MNNKKMCTCNICELGRATALLVTTHADIHALELEKKLFEPIYCMGMDCDWTQFQIREFLDSKSSDYVENIVELSDEDFKNMGSLVSKSEESINLEGYALSRIFGLKCSCEPSIELISCIRAYEFVYIGYSLFKDKLHDAFCDLRNTGKSDKLLSLLNKEYNSHKLYDLAIKIKDDYKLNQNFIDSSLDNLDKELVVGLIQSHFNH